MTRFDLFIYKVRGCCHVRVPFFLQVPILCYTLNYYSSCNNFSIFSMVSGFIGLELSYSTM